MSNRQARDLTFDDIRALLEQDGHGDLLDKFDVFASAALIGGAASGMPALLALLGPKNELVKIGKQLLDRVTGKSPDYQDLHRRMAMAHQLVVFTSFYEAVEPTIVLVKKALRLSDASHAALLDEPALAGAGSEGERELVPMDEALLIPHPVSSFDDKKHSIRSFYLMLTHGLTDRLPGLPGWFTISDQVQGEIGSGLTRLPADALERYEARYFELADRYPQFLVWAGLHERLQVASSLDEVSRAIERVEAIRDSTGDRLDVGLSELGRAVAAIPAAERTEKARTVASGLGKTYANAVAERVIDDSFEEGEVSLVYPRRCDVFIPQSFRVLQARSGTRLEDEQLWLAQGKPREGLGAFVLNYLSSPYSLEAPLIVLGHPGSGKSLLTSMLAARLATPTYNPVRIELRDVDMEEDLQAQIEAQIARHTGQRIDWAIFADPAAGAPPVLILDGFDELLQASGRVHADYLMKVQAFQQRESVLGRPLRAIVTSRITLIDKARVPTSATVMRLEEFDEQRREKWTEVWNKHNGAYFAKAGVERFSLPDDPAVLELAGQPLLLLMLAMFDSDGNQLHRHRQLDRTLLYDNLLRRFIVRERSKGDAGSAFRALAEADADAEVERDMRRLGVAAMSMFNRRSLHILSDQLDKDIRYFDLGRDPTEGFGVALTQADLLLGSFFFVHESRSHSGGRTGDDSLATSSAFEFLHNTFGEFLTADFILSTVVDQARTLAKVARDPELKVAYDQLLQPDSLDDRWFLSLMYTPLFSRPVVLDMIEEWAPHALERARLSTEEFVESLDAFVYAQLRHLLGGSSPPQLMTGDGTLPYERLPLLDHYAVHSLNLILLRLAAAPAPYELDESAIGAGREAGGPGSWERLTQLWRLSLSLQSLAGMASAFHAERDVDKVSISRHPPIRRLTGGRLAPIGLAARALGDRATGSLVALHAYDVGPPEDDLEDVALALDAEGIDLELAILVRDVRARGWVIDPDRDERLIDHLRHEPFNRMHLALFELLADRDAPASVRDAVRKTLVTPDVGYLVASNPVVLGGVYIRLAASLDINWMLALLTQLFEGIDRVAQLSRLALHQPETLADVLDLVPSEDAADVAGIPQHAWEGLSDDAIADLVAVAQDSTSVSLLIALLSLGVRIGVSQLCRHARLRLLQFAPDQILAGVHPERLRALRRAYDAAPDRALLDLLAVLMRRPGAEALPDDVAIDALRIGAAGGRELDDPLALPPLRGLPQALGEEDLDARVRLLTTGEHWRRARPTVSSDRDRERLIAELGITDLTRLEHATWRTLYERVYGRDERAEREAEQERDEDARA